MSSLRLLHFENEADFIEALRPHDDHAMNFALGSLLDNLDRSQAVSQERWGDHSRVLLGIYMDNDLLVTLTKSAARIPWMLSAPSDVDPLKLKERIIETMELLVTFLPTVVDPNTVDKIVGLKDIVDAFIDAWIAFMASKHVALQSPTATFTVRACYATRSTIPQSQPTLFADNIGLVVDMDQAEHLIPLAMEFSKHGPNPTTSEGARHVMREAIQSKRLWVCRLGEAIAGYALVGRITPRTVAIRNVFVLPDYRRRGIAEALVHATTAFYLNTDSAGDGVPDMPKTQVCLQVADPAVERIYKRCGFLIDEDAKDPITGKSGCFISVFRGIVPAM
ncbi:uncharacterized protein FIBRA_06611 [Fibroporia radiculosa]|uniref:N-acetyltransferase domain-containing protein n=1 Tax=Fibroporia radiculosa TaxID=599839 RepID=J4HZD9_9APHY|nr:uncharacterized protein FIBRA_06611 [Fibroporia radiculosa]CCM04432.1 predicted protein [Fibroporia radiculosa]